MDFSNNVPDVKYYAISIKYIITCPDKIVLGARKMGTIHWQIYDKDGTDARKATALDKL